MTALEGDLGRAAWGKRWSMAGTLSDVHRAATFRHEALFYTGRGGFLDGTTPFIRDGIAAGEPTLVVVSAAKIDLLRTELGNDAGVVRFADMDDIGRNPARIIPAWREFVKKRGVDGRRLRGIGEPIWAARSPDELVECERHESLLNLAFEGSPEWWLLCPYDVGALDPTVVEEAQRNHPFIMENGTHRESGTYRGLAATTEPFDRPLPEPGGRPDEITFAPGDLRAVRGVVTRHAAEFGLQAERAADLVAAVNELATNSLRHASGRGLLRVWQQPDRLICEVRDDGRIDEPLAGRELPAKDQVGGFGLWLVTHLCDLVQVRSFRTGSVVRVHMSRP
jgi:anti-sigma regulatory factor (Ser/Thr protein kinase)